MKKILLLLSAIFLLCVNFAQAQISRITDCQVIYTPRWNAPNIQDVTKIWYYLDNGEALEWRKEDPSGTLWRSGQKCRGNLGHTHYPKGTLVYKMGNYYERFSPVLLQTKTISDVKIHEVSEEFISSAGTNLSYRSAIEFIPSPPNDKVFLVNVFFDDGSAISVNAAEDPLWLDAKVGMTVEVYKCGPVEACKLIFKP